MKYVVVTIFLVIAILIFSRLSSTPDQQVTPAPNDVSQVGTITGSLSFPSEEIPEDMVVCAYNIYTKEDICTEDHISNDKFTYGVGYELEVYPGTYEIYAYLPHDPDRKAYFNEFVVCGLLASCPSHEVIQITVEAGEIVDEVDPQDWYQIPEPSATPVGQLEGQM